MIMVKESVNEWSLPKTVKDKLVKNGLETTDKFEGINLDTLFDFGLEWTQIKDVASILIDKKIDFSYLKPEQNRTESDWREFLEDLVTKEIVTWEEITLNTLGELNPPQVGTSTASNENFKKQFPPRKCMQAVMGWFYSQDGKCADCGTRLNLEVDHIKGKDEFLKEGKSQDEADTLDNLQLLCKRCNVIKRESHKFGGLSFATAQSTLMWIIFHHKPKTFEQFCDLCRRYGLTMASVRFQEAWAMAIWLNKENGY